VAFSTAKRLLTPRLSADRFQIATAAHFDGTALPNSKLLGGSQDLDVKYIVSARLWVLAHDFLFEGPTQCRAFRATFQRRKTALPDEPPLALSAEFGADPAKVKQWQAFFTKGKIDLGGISLEEVCAFLEGFLQPPARALVHEESFEMAWPAGGPWQTQSFP
jgi:hypothetical protein